MMNCNYIYLQCFENMNLPIPGQDLIMEMQRLQNMEQPETVADYSDTKHSEFRERTVSINSTGSVSSLDYGQEQSQSPLQTNFFTYTNYTPNVHQQQVIQISQCESNSNNRRRKKNKSMPEQFCSFCLKNGETFKNYSNHHLRNPQTRELECQVLRNYICQYCGKTGRDAHTESYCPKNPSRQTPCGEPLAIRLKGTTRNSTSVRKIW